MRARWKARNICQNKLSENNPTHYARVAVHHHALQSRSTETRSAWKGHLQFHRKSLMIREMLQN